MGVIFLFGYFKIKLMEGFSIVLILFIFFRNFELALLSWLFVVSCFLLGSLFRKKRFGGLWEGVGFFLEVLCGGIIYFMFFLLVLRKNYYNKRRLRFYYSNYIIKWEI